MTKKMIVSLSKRALVFGFLLALMIAITQIFNGDIMIMNVSVLKVLAFITLVTFFFYLLWPLIKAFEQKVDQEEKEDEELFP